jgi:DNA-binding NtrC family response regulator
LTDSPPGVIRGNEQFRGELMGATLLLIEDDDDTAELVGSALQAAMPSFEVRRARTLRDGMTTLAECAPDCVVLDYRLPDGDGLDGLRTIRRRSPSLPVVMLTGAGSEEVAVEAMKLGATDYLVKQGRFVDAVPATVRVALGHVAIVATTQGASKELTDLHTRTSEYCAAEGLVGAHPAFKAILRSAERAAQSEAPVLLEGESGTGKEQIARLIHNLGVRQGAAFVPLNCAALPEALLESELFGHVRGAFSGADRDHRGLFECAAGGTLLLDEIGELPLTMQPKLLRVLQEHEVRAVGSTKSKPVDVRVIAASNRDLRLAVATRQFRDDLFHRLNVLPIRLPPLRERRSDIPLLAEHLVAGLAARERRPVPVLTGPALIMLENFPWSGNVRELENELHRIIVSLDGGTRIDSSHVRHLEQGCVAATTERSLKEIVRDVETATVAERLRQFGYRRTVTAHSLGLTREGLWHKLRQLRLDLPRGRA